QPHFVNQRSCGKRLTAADIANATGGDPLELAVQQAEQAGNLVFGLQTLTLGNNAVRHQWLPLPRRVLAAGSCTICARLRQGVTIRRRRSSAAGSASVASGNTCGGDAHAVERSFTLCTVRSVSWQ